MALFNSLSSAQQLDNKFLDFISKENPDLYTYLVSLREENSCITKVEYSKFIIKLAPYLDDFIEVIFDVIDANKKLKESSKDFDIIFECRRKFVQRYAIKKYPEYEVNDENFSDLTEQLKALIGDITEKNIASNVMRWLEDEGSYHKNLDIAARYCSLMVNRNSTLSLFDVPRKIDPENHIRGSRINQLKQKQYIGFEYRDFEQSANKVQGQAKYCLYCHQQDKDSCSTGLSEDKKGCPLDQKISEMNLVYAQGFSIGALAIITIDNPLVAVTGHRICNDCAKACIFQKQDPVNIPLIESGILESVLTLPYGVEIYYLLTQWNPLKPRSYLPKASTDYNVLITGLGPAGFALSYYLLHEGHDVTAIDGMKIADLGFDITKPIKDWSNLKEKLSTRIPKGFGGVTEYGITHRWDKNNLILVRLILERSSKFKIFDGIRLGSNLTIDQAFTSGFDHIALCVGSGKPKYLPDSGYFAKGVKSAADFLMQLNLGAAHQAKSNSNLQIRMPAIVYGCGLTAVDSAVELMNYYPKQVENFAKCYDGSITNFLTEDERIIADEFLVHAKLFEACKSDSEKIELMQAIGGVTIYYRGDLRDSPAYNLNSEEIEQAIATGVKFIENTKIKEALVDQFGAIEEVTLEDGARIQVRTLLLSLGTEINEFIDLADDFNCQTRFFKRQDKKISYFGDCNLEYHGSVVKALASAKNGYRLISQALAADKPNKISPSFKCDITSIIKGTKKLSENITEITINSPLAAKNFQPGQFFRLQNYADKIENMMEPLALTGAGVEKDTGLISFLIESRGVSSKICQNLKAGEKISLMGPVGEASYVPHNKNIVLLATSLGAALLVPFAQALKQSGCNVLMICGYKKKVDRIWQDKIENAVDAIYWCCQEEEILTSRKQDFTVVGDVFAGLKLAQGEKALADIDYIYCSGDDQMLHQISKGKDAFFKKESTMACSINLPMQCMMKGICAQCLQKVDDERGYVFACSKQDLNPEIIDFTALSNRHKFNSLSEKMKFNRTYRFAK